MLWIDPLKGFWGFYCAVARNRRRSKTPWTTLFSLEIWALGREKCCQANGGCRPWGLGLSLMARLAVPRLVSAAPPIHRFFPTILFVYWLVLTLLQGPTELLVGANVGLRTPSPPSI